MNKYALGTIVGASLLGFVKSKLGSNTRLKTQKYKIKEFALQFTPYDWDEDDVLDPQLERDISEEVLQKYQSVNADGIETIQRMELDVDIYDMDGDESPMVYIIFLISFLDDSNIEAILWDIAHTVEEVLGNYGLHMGGTNVEENFIGEKSFVVYLDEKTGKWKPYSVREPRTPKLRRR